MKALRSPLPHNEVAALILHRCGEQLNPGARAPGHARRGPNGAALSGDGTSRDNPEYALHEGQEDHGGQWSAARRGTRPP